MSGAGLAAGRPPAQVGAAASRAKSGVESSFSGWLDWGDGFAAVIEYSFDAPERQSLELVGTEAAVLVDRAHIAAGGADPYRAMIEHFQAVVRGAAEPHILPT